MAKTIHTDKAPAAIGPYVQGKVVGNFLFASGQVPLSPELVKLSEQLFKNKLSKFLKIFLLFLRKQAQILTMWLRQLVSLVI